MASIWAIIFILIYVKDSHLLSSPFPSRMTYNEEAPKKPMFERKHSCPNRCSCFSADSSLIVNCEFKNLMEIPPNLPLALNNLNIAHNNLYTLIYNTTLKDLNVLNVSQNNLSEIDGKFISSLRSLEVLDMSNNALLPRSIQNKFENPNLRHLNLSSNKLNEITDFMFNALNSLEVLDLSRNYIKTISHNSFISLLSLSTLNLSMNEISDAQYEWFKRLHNLTTLCLKSNHLKLLRNVIFSPLKQLQMLDLSHNYIKSVGLLSFKGLMKLQQLNMSNNNISYFQDGVFRFLLSLKTIDISKNPVLSIDNVFLYSTQLQTLHMNNLSKFTTLTSSSLNGLQNLEYIDLSGSSVFSDISLKAFSHSQKLKDIDISDAKLTYMRMGVFNNLHKIETIKLKGNPWKCDCYMYWLLIWLGEHTNAHLLSPSETFCLAPPKLKGHVLLDALDHEIICINASIQHYTNKTKFKVGSSAYLECQVDGQPLPSLTWITPQKTTFQWSSVQNNTEDVENAHSKDNLNALSNEKLERFYLLPNGNLGIRSVERGDGGFYVCVATNPLNNDSVSIRLTLDYDYLVHIKIVSVLVGVATSFGFLLLTLISVLIRMILKHFGIKSPCHNGNASPRTQQIKKILESMEHYKKQQLDRLRDNYNVQVQKIKDNCMQQMERLRESYSSQAERLRDIKEYGTLQIDRIRENYYSQVQRVRDYSASQIIRLRENYLFQRNRIKKFSAHHLYKLRENYKLQQQHINKILENLNIESCRNVCHRTDSVVFEPEITLENVLVPKICLQTFAKEACDSNDNSSQLSAYFTPDETGSEISGQESDERDNFDNAIKSKDFNTVCTLVRMEQDLNEPDTNIPRTIPVEERLQAKICDQKYANETVV